MAYMHNDLFDAALALLDTGGNRLDVCEVEPTTYTEATSTNTLANKVGISIAAPTDKAGGGREVIVAAITDGTVTGAGDAVFWAISNTTSSKLLATGPIQEYLGNPLTLTPGSAFTLAAFAIGLTVAP